MKTGFVLESYPSLLIHRDTIVVKSHHLYFGFFNRIKHIMDKNEGPFLVLYKCRDNSNFYFHKEIETVTNKALSLFGVDAEYKGDYSEADEQAIRNKTWDGRVWVLNGVEFVLELHKNTGILNLVIGPIK